MSGSKTLTHWVIAPHTSESPGVVAFKYIRKPANADVAIHEFNPPYHESVKEPDAFWLIMVEAIPSLVVEMGWASSYPKRRADMDIWMVGAAPQTRVGFLVNFNSRDDGVASDIEVFRRAPDGSGSEMGPRSVRFSWLKT